MAPDSKDRARKKKRKSHPGPSFSGSAAPQARKSSDDAHDIVYFQRHEEDDASRSVPGREFLDSCPKKVRATMKAVLVAVAGAPPKRFAGGGYWEAMHGGLAGRYEVRVDGPGRRHYRLFCLLDYDAVGRDKPLLVVVDGDSKPFKTTFDERVYARAKTLGDEYLARPERSLYGD